MGQPLTQNGVTSIETNHPDDVRLAAAKMLEICGSHRIFAVYGTMGAGKTTLIKALCQLLGSEDVVKSPTFSIVNEYDSPSGSIFHFDFYRINSLSEVFDIGFEEYLASGSYCFMEWPELIEPLVPEDAVEIKITVTGPEQRKITIAMR
ncbi:MAG TPA: tRNA (adenosine(37)-N6)-threonylcarbamoyltransferase complex ATPase subunit type 1 TsaE [Bacteroidia bacterium]|nr:tRNA (adenosine(37)-N6)-threonylcarbamoyltransferase complex ATPase subunit type 1 TsaE [Bacteroidia bacterium]